ncbi:hypothetical protein LCGC14_0750150 [marine sediment metagenome]|uniref:Uncharacterized protein n=1 Tax=marine sediment metagenome TaxID=412755 RepID=A0A0F9QNZ6_9ZZZZ
MTNPHHQRYLRRDWIESLNFYWTTMDLTGVLLGCAELLELAKKVAIESSGSVVVGETRRYGMDKWRVNDVQAWHDRVREADARARLGEVAT